jgi:hypothetical protein
MPEAIKITFTPNPDSVGSLRVAKIVHPDVARDFERHQLQEQLEFVMSTVAAPSTINVALMTEVFGKPSPVAEINGVVSNGLVRLIVDAFDECMNGPQVYQVPHLLSPGDSRLINNVLVSVTEVVTPALD